MSAKVFITQDDERADSARYNFADLDRFGQKVTLFKRSTYPDEVDLRVQFLVERANKVFDKYEYNPDLDYVALVGDPLGVAVVFMIMGSRGIDKVRALKFDRREGAYYEATIELKTDRRENRGT